MQLESSFDEVIEILGPWLPNRGAEMSMRAVVERLGRRYRLAASSGLGVEKFPVDLPVARVAWRGGMRGIGAAASTPGRAWRALRKEVALSVCSEKLLARHGVVLGESLGGLVDLSGYAYGECWPQRRVVNRTRYLAMLKARGVRLVMLPQALGPFVDEQLRAAAAELLVQYDMVVVRDELSAQHLLDLGIAAEAMSIAPDVSHLIGGYPPREPAVWANRVCLVPNARMLDRTDRQTGSRYVSLFAACLRAVSRHGCEPYLVLHEVNDLPLAREVRMASGIHAPIVECDGLSAKGLFGACRALISSRYQPLVSAFVQGTPALATGWCHKFSGLLGDYESADAHLPVTSRDAEVDARVGELLDPVSQKLVRRRLCDCAEVQCGKVEAMWRQVEEVIAGVGVARGKFSPSR